MQPSPDSIQKEYLNHNKTLLTLFTLNSLMLLACCIIVVVWTITALNKYSLDSQFGEYNLISAILTAIVVLLSLVVRFNSRINIILRAIWTIVTLLFLLSLNYLLIITFAFPGFNDYCGYLISHNGELDGNTITNEIRNRKGTIWCTYPEDSDLSVENSIYDLSVTFITDYCQKKYADQTLSDCINLSSLSVNTRSSVKKPLGYTFIMILMGCFIFAVLSMVLSCRLAIAKKNCLKRHKESLLQNRIPSQQESFIVQHDSINQQQEQEDEQQYQPINEFVTSINEWSDM